MPFCSFLALCNHDGVLCEALIHLKSMAAHGIMYGSKAAQSIECVAVLLFILK
jgi:hypothetical protein